MKDKKAEKKLFATPKQYAICSTFIVIMVFGFTGVMLYVITGNKYVSYIGLLAGGIAGVIMYLIPNKTLDLKRQIKTFDAIVPLMIFLLNWTACEISSSVFGLIAYRFSSIKPDSNDHSTILAIIGAVVIAPVSEELMFRLCSMGLIKKCFGKKFTILFTTVVFTLMHGFYSIQGLINVFAGAIFFAICYYYTENFLYTIIAHMLHNAFCIPDFWNNVYDIKNGYTIMRPLPLAIDILLFVTGMFWLIRVFMKRYGDGESKPINDNETVTC